MLLSMLISFLLGMIFHRRVYVYVLLEAIALFLVVFFSVGFPLYFNDVRTGTSGVIFSPFYYPPVPLSFPFYATLEADRGGITWEIHYYQFNFLTLNLHRFTVGSASLRGNYYLLSWGDYVLFFSFFLLVNIVGAAIGYWMSKRLHLYIQSRKLRTRQTIPLN